MRFQEGGEEAFLVLEFTSVLLLVTFQLGLHLIISSARGAEQMKWFLMVLIPEKSKWGFFLFF